MIFALAYAMIASGLGWAVVFALGDTLVPRAERVRLAVVWFAMTLALFVAPNALIFFSFVTLLLIVVGVRRETDRLGMGLLVLFSAPASGVAIYGLPGINYLLVFTVALFVSVFLFLPAAIKARRPARLPGRGRPGARGPVPLRGVDVAVFSLFALMCLQAFLRQPTFTAGLRETTQISFGMLVPYLAFSRTITTPERLDRVLRIFVVAALVAACVGFFIAVRGWQFYDAPEARLFGETRAALSWRLGLMRSGGPLASSPIGFGTALMVAMALLTGLVHGHAPSWRKYAPFVVLVLGVLGTVARGPLLGLGILAFAYALTRPNAGGRVFATLFGGVALFVPLLLTPFGGQLLNLVPGLGSEAVAEETIDYRQDLLRIGTRVALKDPLFGSDDYLDDPDMQTLVQGQGIVDIVNTYLQWALDYGLVGLGLYVAAVFGTMLELFRTTRRLRAAEHARMRAMTGAMFAGLLAFAVVAFTTTSTSLFVTTLTWTYLGLCITQVRQARAVLAAPPIRSSASSDAAGAPGTAQPDASRPGATEPAAPEPPLPGVRPRPAVRPQPSFGLQGASGTALPPGPRW